MLAASVSTCASAIRRCLTCCCAVLAARHWRAVSPGAWARYEYRELGDEEASPVQLLSGACMLIDRRALAAVGGFDTRFFMYFEDYDLSLRLGAHGTLLYVPSMRIVHHGGGAARKGARHIRWFGVSAWRFYRRHGWRWL
jgi:GT2 family glycosyltransferase